MARRRRDRDDRHPDVEFAVDDGGEERIFHTFEEAAGFAATIALAGGRRPSGVFVNVLIFSEDGALWYGGDDAFDAYEEDPDASVFERIRIKAENEGMVP